MVKRVTVLVACAVSLLVPGASLADAPGRYDFSAQVAWTDGSQCDMSASYYQTPPQYVDLSRIPWPPPTIPRVRQLTIEAGSSCSFTPAPGDQVSSVQLEQCADFQHGPYASCSIDDPVPGFHSADFFVVVWGPPGAGFGSGAPAGCRFVNRWNHRANQPQNGYVCEATWTFVVLPGS